MIRALVLLFLIALAGPASAQPPYGPIQYPAVPACTDTGGNHLNYNATTGAISCGTSSSGGGVELNGTNTWTAQQSVTPTTLSISTATFTPNGSSNNYAITLTTACPCTLANPSVTPVPGTGGQIIVKQSSTGSNIIGTWGSSYVAPGGTATITLSTGDNAVDILAYYVIDTTHIAISLVANFSH